MEEDKWMKFGTKETKTVEGKAFEVSRLNNASGLMS